MTTFACVSWTPASRFSRQRMAGQPDPSFMRAGLTVWCPL
jgi:hypothetical protein